MPENNELTGVSIPANSPQKELDRIDREIDRLQEQKQKVEKDLAYNYNLFHETFRKLKERG